MGQLNVVGGYANEHVFNRVYGHLHLIWLTSFHSRLRVVNSAL